jgi:hypothetical protein
MPSFFKRAKGVQKPQIVAHKPFFKSHGFWYLNPYANPNAIALVPVSSVFDSSDCIWYYGTLYVKEAVAVSKSAVNAANANNVSANDVSANDVSANDASANDVSVNDANANDASANDTNLNEDDDAESICSNSSGNPHKRSIAKMNQMKYVNDGTRLRHLVDCNEWHATFDAETNRIIRTPDGVAFDTLRQFARLHCNEVLGTTSLLNNVWSDPQFQYQDDEGKWHPLSVLRRTVI